jgi:hypothetical protein
MPTTGRNFDHFFSRVFSGIFEKFPRVFLQLYLVVRYIIRTMRNCHFPHRSPLLHLRWGGHALTRCYLYL